MSALEGADLFDLHGIFIMEFVICIILGLKYSYVWESYLYISEFTYGIINKCQKYYSYLGKYILVK